MVTGAEGTRTAGRPWTLAAVVVAVISALTPFTVLLGGAAAVVLAFVAWQRHERGARLALAIAIVLLLFGLVTGGLLVLLEEIGLIEMGWSD